ncbi:UvrD-helicase domain-containing protein [Tsukamurella sp. 8F]|uniref:UvrD-helicase domain-containing protein n=1 Tax=unclassified Tsukamurella TaxID=2633480 RepID=UPI0023B9ACEB|nr:MULTISPECIES: UvrD-helicase domain-containing protein [unclassified Tsukamurella]MDF0532301.1 UvrD-helicase domain-containing protein [Tsukamurella sp. 8J]MDF0588996.1 UvrD-helicase domain-containing protein [Tsukamurella sp. 8F]
MGAKRDSVLPVTPFDLTGPLPTGTNVLEASAGTGKTYAIVGLMVRYVAEGHARLDDLLLVTFSRAASRELRERARSRLVSAERALRDPGTARAGADELVAFLARPDDGEVARRHARLARAVADFDSATVTTTHGFCQQMLIALGLAGDLEPDVQLVEEVDDLVAEAADDIYLRAYARADRPGMSIDEARDYARTAVANPGAVLSPSDDPRDSASGERVAFAGAVRREVDRRKRAGRLRDFDDLQVLLRDALKDPLHGRRACERLRRLYKVVLVDEFQDTDPVQWDIFRTAFHGHADLVLVGDPKQSIYAFRGAEVLSYLAAADVADRHQALTTNWRTDGNLVTALHALYGDTALGDPRIVAHHVEAAHPGTRLSGVAPLRIRCLARTGHGPTYASGYPRVDRIRPDVAQDVAADIVALLGSGAECDLGRGPRPLEPGDIAVLARTGAQVALVQAALQAVGVPSVVARGSSVFGTASATDWLWVLQALESPHRGDRARLAALTPLLGYTADQLAAGGDELVSDVSGRLRGWSRLFEEAGFAAMFARLARDSELEARLLSQAGGERVITDLRHIAELLQRETVAEGLGLTALTRWLGERVADPAAGASTDRSRRLETDIAAVQVMTVHASKGLEFPIVYLPYAWDAARPSEPRTLLLHADDGARLVDVGTADSPGYSDRRRRAEAEEAAEELRLLYVGATRAKCQVTLTWAPSSVTSRSALNRLLFGRNPAGEVPVDGAEVPSDTDVPGRLREWAADASSHISAEPAGRHEPRDWVPPDIGGRELALAVAGREVDHAWRRTSYSALIASAAHGPASTSEPEALDRADEPTEEPADAPVDAPDAPSSLMNGLSGGAAFGTLVHEILEHVDTAAADLEAEVLERCAAAAAFGGSPDAPEDLAHALVAVLRTRLGGALGELTLSGVEPRDHLAELDFELPLGSPDTSATLATIADLLDAHLPADDPLAGYAERLREVPGAALRGYLTGSIDSVLRVRSDGDRYVVVDYKTNRLARGDLTLADYTPDAMAAEMISSHYVLQALLYSVALHRFLRWRLADYAPERHIGVVQYHFVRAMIGPDAPAGSGVFEWHPPAALVTAVSDALAGTGGLP